MRNIILLILIFTSCGSVVTEKDVKSDTIMKNKGRTSVSEIVSSINYRPCKSLSASFVNVTDSLKKALLINTFTEDFENISADKIVSIIPKHTPIYIDEFGLCQVFEIKLSNDLPSILKVKNILIYNEVKQQGVLLQMEDFEPIKVKNKDNAILLGGTYKVREKGYFSIYKYDKKGGFILIFDSSSDSFCGNGIPTFDNSLNCYSYSPYLLSFKNEDVTNDGLNDLVFTGKLLSFCQGLETGYGRNDRKALKEENIKIVFKTNVEKDSLTWTLLNSSSCTLLQKAIQ